MSRPRLGARIVRGLRIMRATASIAIDSAEVCDDEADDLQHAIDWLDALLRHWESRTTHRTATVGRRPNLAESGRKEAAP